MDPNTDPLLEEYTQIQTIRAQQQRDSDKIAEMLRLVQARGNQNTSATNEPLPAQESHLNKLSKQDHIAQEERMVELEQRMAWSMAKYEERVSQHDAAMKIRMSKLNKTQKKRMDKCMVKVKHLANYMVRLGLAVAVAVAAQFIWNMTGK